MTTKPSYEALSYVWNPTDGSISPDAEHEIITILEYNDFRIHAAPNLACAIHHLRRTYDVRAMWIDAICINQVNVEERNHQVALMSEVYGKATMVIIWLGPPLVGLDFDTEIIADDGLITNASQFLLIINGLFKRDWFFRVWVAQELALSPQDPVVYCGRNSLSWSRLSGFIRYAYSWYHTIEDLGVNRWGESRYFAQEFRNMGKHCSDPIVQADVLTTIVGWTDIRAIGRQASFPEQFARMGRTRATDCRDRVYGILGICTFRERPILADYTKTKEEVSIEATSLVIEEELNVYMSMQLWKFNPRWGKDDLGIIQSQLSLPSWAPDLSRIEQAPAYSFPNDIKKTISALHRRPVTEFSKDRKILHTVGCFMGHTTVSYDGDFALEVLTDQDYRGLTRLLGRHLEPVLKLDFHLVALFGIRAPFLLYCVSSDPPTYAIFGFAEIRWRGRGYYFRHWSVSAKGMKADLGIMDTAENIAREDSKNPLVDITIV